MKSPSAQSLMDQIDLSIKDCTLVTPTQQVFDSYLAKYLIVFISGIYEESIETIINDMVANLGSPHVSSFVKDRLSMNFQNPNFDNISNLVKKFGNITWSTRLSAIPLIAKDSINSIVSNKNAIAHGSPVVITIRDVISYYNESKQIIDVIDDMML